MKLSSKTKQRHTKSETSITKQGSSYVVSYKSKQIGTVLADLDAVLDFESGSNETLDAIALAEFGPPNGGFSYSYAEYPIVVDGVNKYLFNVHDTFRTNDLPYGSFIIESPMFEPMRMTEFKLDSSTLLYNPLNLYRYVETLKAGKVGRKNKSGILLYGPAGTGKSSSINELSKYCTEENNLRMFFLSPEVSMTSLYKLRDAFKGSYVVFVIEELTDFLQAKGFKDVLTFLDGEYSWENSLTICTTNYPEKLPANLLDRPGRFEHLIQVKKPTDNDIKELGKLFNIDDVDALLGKDLSYDYISHVLSNCAQSGSSVSLFIKQEKEKRKFLSETFKGSSNDF